LKRLVFNSLSIPPLLTRFSAFYGVPCLSFWNALKLNVNLWHNLLSLLT